MLIHKMKRLSTVWIPLLLLAAKVKSEPTSLQSCGEEMTATSAYCKLSLTENTFCMGGDNKIYDAKSSGCSVMPIGNGSYQIFKQKSAEAKTIFSKGVGSDTDVHIAYKGGNENAATQQNGIHLFESNKLLECTSAKSECKVTVKEGLYYAANTKKIVSCNGKTCTEKGVAGIYYLKNLAGTYDIYECNSSTGTFTCSNVAAVNAAPAADGDLNVQSEKLQWYYTTAKDFIDPEGTTTYLILDKSIANTYFATGTTNDIFIRIDKYSAEKVDVKIGYYVKYGVTSLDKALYYCTGTSLSTCSEVDAAPGYYMVGNDTGSAKSYIKCTSTSCTEIDFVSYDSCGNPNELEQCGVADPVSESETCYYGASEGEICKSGVDGEIVFYESGKNSCFEYVDYTYKSPYQFFNEKSHRVLQESSVASAYKCDVDTDTGELSNCSKYNNQLPLCVNGASTTAACIAGAADDTYCFNTSNSKIYKNTSESCTEETSSGNIDQDTTKYYYFDKEFKIISEVDTNSKIYASYKCDNSAGTITCTSLNDASLAKKVGEVIRTPTSVEMCTGTGNSIPLLNDANKYSTITTTGTGFVGLSANTYTYKTIGKGIIYIDENTPASLPVCDEASGDRRRGNPPNPSAACTSNAVNVPYCIYGENNVIYKTDKPTDDSYSCSIITGTAEGSSISYYDKDYKEVTSVSSTSEIRYAYKCTFGTEVSGGKGNAEKCTLLRGYTISGSYVVMCSGSKYDDCIVSSKGSNSACKATDNDGSIKSGGLAVCFGTNEVTLPTAAATAPNYIAFKSTGLNPAYGVQADGKYVLMELTSNYAVKVTTYPVASTTVYFINQASRDSLVKCTIDAQKVVTNCEEQSSNVSSDNTKTYFVDGSDNKKIITCTYQGNCVSSDVVSALANEAKAYYINGATAGSIITCTGGDKCAAQEVPSYGGGEVYYYIDGSDSSKKSVIKCASSKCTSEIVLGGLFLSSTNVDEEKYVKCNGSSCSYATDFSHEAISESSGLQYNDASITGEKFIKLTQSEANSIYGNNNAAIVKITSTEIVKVSPSVGYYPMVGASSLTDALIYCTNTNVADCVVKTVVAGYYIYPYEDEKIIKCTTSCSVQASFKETENCSGDKGTIFNVGTNSNPIPMMCTSTVVNEALPIGAAAEKYLIISGGIQDITDGDIKVTKENSITKAEEALGPLVTCTTKADNGDCKITVGVDSNVVVASCIESNAIYTNNGHKCEKIKDTPGGTGIFSYYSGSEETNKFEKVTTINTSSKISYAYSCNFGEAEGEETTAEVTGCTQVIGYTVATSSYAVYCSGLKGKDCKVQSLSGSCSNTDEGKLLKSGTKYNLCFGSTNSITLPTGNDETTVAFYTDVASQYYGKFGFVFLKLTKNTVSPLSTDNSDSIDAGYYVNENANSLKNALIYCSDLDNCELVDAVIGYFTSGLGEEYIITCDTRCKTTKIDNVTCGYLNVLPICESTEATEKCIDDATTDTYCLGTDGIIYKTTVGETNSCTPLAANEDGIFYFDSDHKITQTSSLTYYECDKNSNAISNCELKRKQLQKCPSEIKANEACNEDAAQSSVCITSAGALYENGVDEDGNKTCTPYKGYKDKAIYFNSNYIPTSDVASIEYSLKCSGGGSESVSALSSCSYISQTAGGVIKTSSGPQMCVSNDDNDVIEIGSATTSYKVINVKVDSNGNTFPGVTIDSTIRVKVTGDEGVTNGIMKIEDETSIGKGVERNGGAPKKCNGWKGDDCRDVTTVDTCTKTGDVITSGTGICIGSTQINLPEDNYFYVAFTNDDINGVYGINKGEIVLLKLTKDSAFVVTDYSELGNKDIYLIDYANPVNEDGKEPLIVCNAIDGCRSISSGTVDKIVDSADSKIIIESGIANTYYVDGAYPLGDRIINCSQTKKDDKGAKSDEGKCESITPSSNDAVLYYVDSGTSGNLITCKIKNNEFGYGNIPTCTKITTGTECEIGDGIQREVGQYCIKDGKLYITISGVVKCKEVFTCQSNASSFGLYKTNTNVENENIILCDGEENISCKYLTDITSCKDTESEEAIHEGEILIDESIFKICKEGTPVNLSPTKPGYVLMDSEEARKLFKGVSDTLLIENKISLSPQELSMTAVPIKNGYYVNAGSDSDENLVIQCVEGNGCETVVVDDINCDGVREKLPTCTNIESDKECIKDATVDSHCIRNGKIYRTLSGEEKCKEVRALVTCEDVTANKCFEAAGDNDLCMFEGSTYISLKSGGCKEVSTLEECTNIESGSLCVEEAAANSVCRKGDKLYMSESSSCTKVATLLDNVNRITLYFDNSYMNINSEVKSSTSDNVKAVYKCNNRNGELSSCEVSSSSPGSLIYSQSAGQIKLTKICVNHAPVSNNVGIDYSAGYKTIQMEKANSFPGLSTPGTNTVDILWNHVLLMKKDELLPECDAPVKNSLCKSNGEIVKQCLYNNKILYISNESKSSCDIMTGTSNRYSFIYFDHNDDIIDENDVRPEYGNLKYIYKCEYDGSGNAERCYIVRGYVIINGFIINCNGWSSCSFTRINSEGNSCLDAREGTIRGDGTRICFETNEKSLTYGTEYIFFKAESTNEVYGKNENNIVVLSITEDSVTAVPFGEGITRGYHQNINVRNELENALILCEEDGNINSCHVVNGLNGYYLNKDSDASTYPVIRCEERLGCSKQSVSTSSNCEPGVVIESGGKIYICKDTTFGNKEELSTNNTEIKYSYIAGINASFPGVIEENKSFVKIGTDGSVTLLSDGVYLNEVVKGKVDGAIYNCSTERVTTTCNADIPNYGYYKNAGTTNESDVFIACSVNGCENISVDENGICSMDTVGQLYGSTTINLCLDYNSDMDKSYSIELGSDTKGCLVSYYPSNVFGVEINKYAYVNVNSSSVELNSDYKKYVYTSGLGLEENNGSCAEGDAKGETLNEFKYDEPGIYSLNCSDNDNKDNLCPDSSSSE